MIFSFFIAVIIIIFFNNKYFKEENMSGRSDIALFFTHDKIIHMPTNVTFYKVILVTKTVLLSFSIPRV